MADTPRATARRSHLPRRTFRRGGSGRTPTPNVRSLADEAPSLKPALTIAAARDQYVALVRRACGSPTSQMYSGAWGEGDGHFTAILNVCWPGLSATGVAIPR